MSPTRSRIAGVELRRVDAEALGAGVPHDPALVAHVAVLHRRAAPVRVGVAEAHRAEQPGDISRADLRLLGGRKHAFVHHEQHVVGAHHVGLGFLEAAADVLQRLVDAWSCWPFTVIDPGPRLWLSSWNRVSMYM